MYREGDGTPLQYSCPENPMDRGAWGAAVHGVPQTRILEWVAILSSRGIFLAQGSSLRLLCFLHW